MNILWEDGHLRIRDIHLFNENLPDIYTTQVATENECTFFTLPVVDGYLWSKKNELAGLRLKAVINGTEVLLEGKQPVFKNVGNKAVHISWPLSTVKGSLEMQLDEKSFRMQLVSAAPCSWYLELNTVPDAALPFKEVTPQQLHCSFENMAYSLQAVKGTFSKPGSEAVLRITPQKNAIGLNLAAGAAL